MNKEHLSSRNAKFLENEFILKKYRGSRLDLDEVREEKTNIELNPRPLKRAATEQPQGYELRRYVRLKFHDSFHIQLEGNLKGHT